MNPLLEQEYLDKIKESKDRAKKYYDSGDYDKASEEYQNCSNYCELLVKKTGDATKKKEYYDAFEKFVDTSAKLKSMKTGGVIETKYDVALSFADEDREIAEKLANALMGKGIKVFYDNFYKSELFGKDLTDYFQRIYGREVRFVVALISKYYRIKDGANFEFSVAMEEAKKRRTEFILPVRLDDTKILGLPYYIGYLEFNQEKIDGIVKCIVEKVKKDCEVFEVVK